MHIHFIGIGGIGVSALARYFLAQKDEVSGSDLAASQITEALAREGAEIFIGPHKAGNIKVGVDLVVYSAAATKDNPELIEAHKRGIKCRTYAQALGDLTKKYFTIAISGMHGKSTTTAMIGLMMEEAGLDPTVIVGTRVRWGQNRRDWGDRENQDRGNYSNFRPGKSKYLVIEADEYNASFLNYWPKVMVITNIEEEHLDYYKNLRKIKETFKKYIGHLGKGDILVVNGEDRNIEEIIFNFQFSIFKGDLKSKFQIRKYSAKDKNNGLKLKIPGRHNLSNAAAVAAVAKILGINKEVVLKALNNFNGTWRRMEYKGEINGARVYDDYGHHPTEIKATLEGARELLAAEVKNIPPALRRRLRQGEPDPPSTGGEKPRLWCVFQPHQYQRTHLLFDKFAESFDAADKVVLLSIYSVAGREKESIKKGVSSEKLAEAIKEKRGGKGDWGNKGNKRNKEDEEEIIFLPSFNQAVEYLARNLKKGDVCLIMGAGNIYKLTEELFKTLKHRILPWP